jgi:hypothetical protein
MRKLQMLVANFQFYGRNCFTATMKINETELKYGKNKRNLKYKPFTSPTVLLYERVCLANALLFAGSCGTIVILKIKKN